MYKNNAISAITWSSHPSAFKNLTSLFLYLLPSCSLHRQTLSIESIPTWNSSVPFTAFRSPRSSGSKMEPSLWKTTICGRSMDSVCASWVSLNQTRECTSASPLMLRAAHRKLCSLSLSRRVCSEFMFRNLASCFTVNCSL